ncbi:MAG: S-methyl-5'-thioadenosine phosphorylase [Candidatus Aenigmarchaeota archaeon]|nr:S-methyl-5'-thioadenosine phosphorylase [Candidatus Aenigmarchaeota archaeon]MDI6722002.1 S-methyl-5'-thioadenosine phosphorylase [Candidatus Aenigmarchaeota archaeon]
MIGVFGGSGFYSLLEKHEKRETSTPFGPPSSLLHFGNVGKKEVIFLARHGDNHHLPPHKIPYKANVWAMHEYGAKRILAPSAVGSLKKEIEPGTFVIPDQFINFTHGRDDTFYSGKHEITDLSPVTHISASDPYCPKLSKILAESCKELKVPFRTGGTIIVIQGPRFSTKAESAFFQQHGDIINMTQYPECVLARELQICYANISLVTDYDTGLGLHKSVSAEEVLRVFRENTEKLKQVILRTIEKIDYDDCSCMHSMEGARFK